MSEPQHQIKLVLERAISQLSGDSAQIDAEVLLAFVLGKGRSFLRAFSEYELSELQQEQFEVLLARRKAGEPVAYLVGEREFWSLPLRVSPEVLIPRPDTEVLVEQALSLYPSPPPVVLDLGTGTGAIALALKSEWPSSTVLAVDRYIGSLQIAQHNAGALKLPICLLQANWAQAIGPKSVDLLVSNPPYIDSEDPHLTQGDVRFEPTRALVAADQGLADIEVITEQATSILAPDAWLLFEHGWQQATQVQQKLIQYGFSDVRTIKDYAGNDRVTLGRWSK